MAVKTSRGLADLRRLGHLHPGDPLHLVRSQGCVDREVAGELPGGNYLLTDGGSVRPLTALNYHRPDQCRRKTVPTTPQSP